MRTLDIEEVGRTTRHGSFFQMNGNFSFGDYFKEEAIAFAWELSTTPVAEGGYGLDPARIWVTVHHTDDESRALWRRIAGLQGARALVVTAVNQAARAAGHDAAALVRRLLDGKGGASPEIAQGGGLPAGELAQTLRSVKSVIAETH